MEYSEYKELIKAEKKEQLLIKRKRQKIANSVFAILFAFGGVYLTYGMYKIAIDKPKGESEELKIARTESYGTITDFGFSIESVQSFLKIKLRNNMDIDGSFGEDTFEAIKKYQKNNGLNVDGNIGQDTIYFMILDGFCDKINCMKINENISKLILSFDKNGVRVEDLQDCLKKNGYYNGKIDGNFGLGTYKAILKLKIENNLDIDVFFDTENTAKIVKETLGL